MISEMSKLKNGRFRFGVRCKDTARLGNRGEIKGMRVKRSGSFGANGKRTRLTHTPKLQNCSYFQAGTASTHE